MRPEHGPIRFSEHAIPSIVCHVSRAGSREKEDPVSLKDRLYLWFFPLSPICNPCSPLVFKRRARHPAKGTDRFHTQHITQHIAKQQPSSWHPFDPSIRDLGPVPLLTVCTPYYEPFFGANNTSSSRLDIGTFCLNQYKPCAL